MGMERESSGSTSIKRSKKGYNGKGMRVAVLRLLLSSTERLGH
jgi:hypothetical protein